MSWLKKRAKKAVRQALSDWDEFPYPEEKRKLAESVEAVAREFAERACRQMNNPTAVNCKCKSCNDTVNGAIAAAEEEP